MSDQDDHQHDGQPLTPEEFDQALKALGWKASDFCRRVGIVPNTAWRWSKGHAPIPLWVGEYLGAVYELHRLHLRFVDPSGPGGRLRPPPAEQVGRG